MRKRYRVLLGFLFSAFCIIWVFRSVEGGEISNRLANVDPTYLIFTVVLTAASYVLRAMRWKLFFNESAPKLFDSFRCVIVGFFMNNVLPARIGEFVRAHIGGRVTGLNRSTVLATIAGERLADGLAISAIFSILFSFGSHGGGAAAADGIYYVSWLFLFAALGTLAVLIFRRQVIALLERIVRWGPANATKYAITRIEWFLDGLGPLLRPKRALAIGLSSAVIWGVELLAYFCVAQAYSQHLTLAELGLFLAAVNFSSLIPAAPAGIGVIEAFATAALVRVGLVRETALAMVASQHIIQMAVVGIPGSFMFFALRRHGDLPQQTDAVENE